MFAAASNQAVLAGSNLIFNIAASDPVDNDPVTNMTALLMPPGTGSNSFSFSQGTGTFTWVSAGPTGSYEAVFTASDKDGTTTQTVLITVNAASDGDHIDDAWEQQFFGNLTTANNTSDFDGDAFIDLHEFLAGTIPTNAASYLRASSLTPAGTNVVIQWAGVTGKLYGIRYSTNLTSGIFSALASNIPGMAPLNSLSLIHI